MDFIVLLILLCSKCVAIFTKCAMSKLKKISMQWTILLCAMIMNVTL